MFACNPRALFEYFYFNNKTNIDFVWVINESSADLEAYDNIIKVRYNSLAYFYYQMTSKIIVSNIPSPIYLPLRRKQIMIDTWHGGGAYKRVGLLSPKQESLVKKSKGIRLKTIEDKNNQAWEQYKAIYNAKDTTFFVSSCKRFTEVMMESQLLPGSAYIETGMPRNDVFFSDYSNLAQKAKSKLGIAEDKKIVLYAPTYRGNVKSQKTVINLDIELCLKSLEQRWNSEWVFVFRGHVLGFHEQLENEYIINASQYEEMQELLCLADAFITDYSSSMWDFALTKKPAFLFTPDLDYYLNNDRGFYTPIDEWAFPYARTNIELSRLIERFDYDAHLKKVDNHLFSLGSFEQGTATKTVCEILLSHM